MPPIPSPTTASGPWRRGGWIATALALALSVATSRAEPDYPAPSREHARGGRVGWARLIVPDMHWDIHTDQDPKLAAFIRSQTTLNIEPVWFTADPRKLDQLSHYPFIYAKELTQLDKPDVQANLREYLNRGGTLFIDPCTNRFTEEQKIEFQRRHDAYFTRLLPNCTVRELPDDHEIYHCYFSVTVDDLFTPDMLARGAARPPRIRFHGVFLGERLVAVISISGLECGWPETPQRMPGCMRLIVNSYVYAMTH